MHCLIQVRARTSVGYGPYTSAKEVKLTVVSDPELRASSDNSSTIAAASVLAVLGWVILIVVVVVIVILIRRRIWTKQLNL